MVSALRSRVVSCVLVLFTLMGTTGTWHAAGDDPDCGTATTHDHSAHHERLNAARRTTPPAHCAICHWLQGFRTDTIPAAAATPRDATSSPVLALTRRPRQLLVRIDVPSRAPPAQFS